MGGFLLSGDAAYLRVGVQPVPDPITFPLFSDRPLTLARRENDVNPAMIIRFAVPGAGHVRLDVYNALGQRVDELVSEDQHAGYYDVRFDASRLPSGVYFVRLAAGSFTAVTKMYLLK